MSEHKMLWEKWCDRYYLQLLDKSLNRVPDPPKQINEMTEAEVHDWLRNIKFEEMAEDIRVKFRVKIPLVDEFCKSMQSIDKTDIFNLPLSLEDNSTLTGTASILKQFATEFSIPCDKPNGYIEFDNTKKDFDLKAARERYSFMKLVQMHHTEMVAFEKELTSSEKYIAETDVQYPELDGESDDSDSDTDDATRMLFDKHNDNKFNTLLKQLTEQAQETVNSYDDHSCLDKMVHELSRGNKKINDCRDRYDRTIFHAAVEEKQYTLVNILLACGINPNVKEGCGATPMSIAVINSDFEMCKLLLTNFGEYQGELFGSFPSPLEMAVVMESNEIINLFNSFSKNLETPIVAFIQGDGAALTTPESIEDDDMCNSNNDNSSSNVPDKFAYKRSECKEFPTAVVGDVGTCKNNRSVKNRDGNAYGWCAEIPGDMHAKGYLCEAAFKALGNGGFHKVVNVVMKRPRLTKEAYKKRKFQDQNLNRIKESVRDGSQSYGMAAVKEFHSSPYFPSADELKKSLTKWGNHNEILLDRFKKWLTESADIDENHRYHQQLFTLFGPLLELFITAGKQGDGNLREIVWVIMLPIFAQLNFRNYWTEAFVHVVNFTALWPLAFREMVKRNSTVNLNGKSGHNLDLDEYVETHIVRPLKTYVTGKQE
jgi:ankyrin repeat protein